MAKAFTARLTGRGVVSVTGPDASKLLQGVITNDIAALVGAPGDQHPALFSGLLSPQGKVIFDFFAVRTDQGYVIDVARDQAAALTKRLNLYKLRAAAIVTDISETTAVLAVWGDSPFSFDSSAGSAVLTDPRRVELGLRIIAPEDIAADVAKATNGMPAAEQSYHAHRIALGVPEGGLDYAFGAVFPHEALFDQLHGVSFAKGCYVGQEIVSRMEHRGTARNRIVKVSGDGVLPAAGTPVIGNEVTIGVMGSCDGNQGLAMVRLDRLAEFIDRGISITAGGQSITAALQDWVSYSLSDFTRTARL